MKFQRKNQKQSGCVVFDLESIAQDEKRLLTLAPNFEAPSNYKDEAKIAANIVEQKRKYIERAALDFKTAEIVLIGYYDGQEKWMLNDGRSSEACLLQGFLFQIGQWIKLGRKFGGHGVRGFDLPMIVNRSRCLGLELPDGLLQYSGGYPRWNELIFDTANEFSFSPHPVEGTGVDDVCKAMGIEGKRGSGAEFGSLWKTDKQSAIEYCLWDVDREIQIAKACGYKF